MTEITDLINICDPELVHELKLAVDAERLPREFTTSDVLHWMKDEAIKKSDGTEYPKITRELLANYAKHTPVTKKRRQKVLYMSPNGKVFAFNPF